MNILNLHWYIYFYLRRMYKMGILPDETIGTITVTDADGKTDVAVEFEFTDITSTGEVSLDFTSKTGVTAVPIALKGKANMDGSIDIDLAVSDGASFDLVAFGLVASGVAIGSLTVADPKLASDIMALAKTAKAYAKALRAQRLALQDESLATTEVKSALRNTADNVGKLSGLLPGNQTIGNAASILNALATSAMDVLEGDTLAEAIGAAQAAADAAPQTAAELAAELAAGQNAAEDAAEAVTALTASVNRQITELQKVSSAKISAKAKKVAAKISAKAKKVDAKKAVAKLQEWNKGK